MAANQETSSLGIAVEQISIDLSHINNEPDTKGLAIIPTRNLVLFPEVTISIALRRPLSIEVAQRAYEKGTPVGIVCQTDPEKDDPALTTGLYRYGVIADVLKIIDMPNGEKTALVHGRTPFRILGVGAWRRHYPIGCLVAKVKLIEPKPVNQDDKILRSMVESVQSILNRMASNFTDSPFNALSAQGAIDNQPGLFVNIAMSNFPCEPNEKVPHLREDDIQKAAALLAIVTRKEQEMELSLGIIKKARSEMDEEQRRVFLMHQMEAIQEQLYGDSEDELQKLEKSAKEKNLPADAREAFDREISRLRRINPQSPDYSVIYTYLDTLLSLPWDIKTEINNDFSVARDALDQDHCGLEKVKERILEQLAVMMHNPKGKSPILCLVGPPGVGKTSLGQSIAKSLNRNYQRVSLGGLHDESEIRGHRRTYVGAMPGRIIDAVKKSGSINPVLVLDEIDKIGSDYKGDPAAALLEVLDPEQNCHFHDNYIDADFDLSNVLFIATANTTSTLSKPLLDRMEVIELSGYLAEEKQEIARKHLMRRIFQSLNIADGEFEVSDAAIAAIIEQYTAESGVRQLEKALSTIARKYVLAKMSHSEFPIVVEPDHLKQLLGTPIYNKEKYEGNRFAGVVTGLAWTQVGGEILMVESSLTPGDGTKRTITGNLGNVMKESATIALEWVKSHASQLGIDPALFGKYDLHLHFPEGAVPKDGPSAGITIATSIVSCFKQTRVRERIAMTGEITLRGKVLPVGGIKEKILAAKRAGITDIILSAENRKDIDDIEAKYIDGVTFHYVDTVMDVMRIAITDEPAEDPIAL